MQSLWSRVGMAHRCGCRACETAISTLGRRVTTATRPRKPTFAEVFTAAYSSVFASAAVVDAIRKEDRKQELDRQLEETRREVAELQNLQTVEMERVAASLNDPNRARLTREQEEELWLALKDIYINRPFMKEIHKPVSLRISDLLARLQTDHYHCPNDATMQAMRRIDYEKLEQAIMAEELDPNLLHRTVQNDKQLHNDSRTVVHMVRQLLKRAAKHDRSQSPSPAFDEACKLVSQRNSTSYTFEAIDPMRAAQSSRELNEALREVVASTRIGLKEKVGRVCYNMLVSSYSPNMHTYNTLIVALDKSGHSNLAESLVNSFFYYRRLAPTPSTFVAILNHYKKTNNHGQFLRTLACITGLDETTGAKLGRREPGEGWETDLKFIEWVNGEACTATGNDVRRHAPLHQDLVEAIISGLLHFKLFEQAATCFVSCVQANVSLGTRAIRQLFDECIVALDWKAALRLIQGFTACQRNLFSALLDREDATPYLIGRVHVLLDICGLQREPDESTLASYDISDFEFGQFLWALDELTHATGVGASESIGSSREELDGALSSSMSRVLQIESLWKEQVRVERTVHSIESKLLYPDFEPDFRASMAMHIAGTATEASQKLNYEFMGLFRSKLRLPGVRKTLAACEQFGTESEQLASSLMAMAKESAEQADGPEENTEVEPTTHLNPIIAGWEDLRVPTPTKPVDTQVRRPEVIPRRIPAWPASAQPAAFDHERRAISFG